MSRTLYRIGHFAGRHPWRVLTAWLLVAAAVFVLNMSFGGAPDNSFRLPGAESQQAADAIAHRFPTRTLFTSNIVFHDEAGISTPAVKTAVTRAVTVLARGAHVVAVTDPYDPRGPTVSADGRTAFATVGYDTAKIKSAEFDAADLAIAPVRALGVQVEFDGDLGYAKGDEEPGGEMFGVGVAVIVLLIAFGSLVAMSLPIVVALTAILIGTSTLGLIGGFIAMPKIATTVGLMLGLGVGIDYALFVLARHRRNLESGMTVPEAVGRANATSGLSVLFAGVTVIVAIAGLQVSGIPMLTTMGWASALMVAVTMLAALSLLPAMLGLVGRRVNSVRLPFIKAKPADNPNSKSARWAARVVARPIRYGAVAAVLLGVLAIPVFSMHLGFSDAGNDGPSTTTRKAYDLMAKGYGPGVNGTLQVVVDTHGAGDADVTLAAIGRALKAEPGVASVSPPTLNSAKDLAVFDVTPTTSPQDDKTAQLLHRLRDHVLPNAVGNSKVEPLVTGGTALMDDVSARLQQRMLWFLAAVIGLSFVVLTLVFRSILVPLKAAALNLISVGAAYGVVVAVFQWGWGASLIGVHATVPIMSLAPMLMFAILFGLSMDYEVFLVSQIRERYLHHGDPKRAIVEGVGSTGRVITSAALIMISVFGSFILGSDIVAKMFGVGLAVAVLLDVTLVRMVLVPSVLSLLGHRAWWLPKWLDRRLPVIHLEGAEAAVTDAGVTAPEPDRVPVLV